MRQLIQYVLAATLISILAGFHSMHAKAADNFVPIFYDQCASDGSSRVFSNRNHISPGKLFFALDDCEYKRSLCREWYAELRYKSILEPGLFSKIRRSVVENCRGLLP